MIYNKKTNKKALILDVAKDLFLLSGIKDTSMAHIASKAGIGKGTIYSYFKNKDEIVFEVFKEVGREHLSGVKEDMADAKSAKEKLYIVFGFYMDKNKQEYINLFAEYYTVCISDYNKGLKSYINDDYSELFIVIENILEDALKSGEITFKDSYKLAKSISASIDGLFFYSVVMKDYNLKYEIENYLDTLFDALSV